MIKHGLLFAGSALMLFASPLTAQDASEPEKETTAQNDFGATVSDMAKGQRDAEQKGIGTQVSEMARARGADQEEGEDDLDEVDDVADGASGLGAEVSELAADQRDADAKGIGVTVRDMARPADVSEARAAASAAREQAKQARASAQEAREQAKQARATARDARDNARDARGNGRGGR